MPTTSQLLNDPKFQGAIKCVKAVRKSPGVVREQDLRASWAEVGPRPLSSVNDALGFEALVAGEPNPSNARPRLDVVCTNPEWRMMIDLLLGGEDAEFREDFGLAPFAERAVAIPSQSSTEMFSLELHLEHPSESLQKSTLLPNPVLEKASSIYAKLGHGRVEMDLPRITMQEILNRVNDGLMNWSTDLVGKAICDFDATELPAGFEIVDFNANRSVFIGTCCRFDNAILTGSVTFRNAVFLTENVSFRHARFACPQTTISFRNARIFSRNLDFTYSTFTADALSFEDATLGQGGEETKVFFSSCELRSVNFDFFQTRAPRSTIQFVDCSFGDRANFRDSEVAHLVLVNVDLRDADLRFRPAAKSTVMLEIEKSRAFGTLKIENVQCLSLFGTVLKGSLVTQGRRRNGSALKPNLDVLNAILQWPAYGLSRDELSQRQAQQLWALKHNFQSLGEHQQEDEALTLFLRTRGGGYLARALGYVGAFVLKPGRVALAICSTLLFFAGVFYSLLERNPAWFKVGEPFSDNHLIAGLFLSFSRLVPIPVDIAPLHIVPLALSLIEAAFSWLLLVMLSATVVRRLT